MSNLVTEDRALLAQISSLLCMYVCMYFCLCWVSVALHGFLQLQGVGPALQLRGLGSSLQCSSSCGAQVLGAQAQLRQGRWDLPRPGTEHSLCRTFPTLAGGFLTTRPPGKSPSLSFFLFLIKFNLIF